MLHCFWVSSLVQALKSLMSATQRSAQSLTQAILLTMMTVYLNDSVSGQNETGTDRKLSSRPRMYVRCVDPKCCWWEMLWSRGSHVLLSYFPLAMPCLRLSPVVTLRRELVSPAHGWDTTNVSSLHSAQHCSVICHWMLWASQSDECDWLVYPQHSRSAGEPWLTVGCESLQSWESASCKVDHSLVSFKKQLDLQWINGIHPLLGYKCAVCRKVCRGLRSGISFTWRPDDKIP